MFFYSFLSFLKTIILNYLSENLYIYISLGQVTGKLLHSFGGDMFPGFFFFYIPLNTCIAFFVFEETITSSGLY